MYQNSRKRSTEIIEKGVLKLPRSPVDLHHGGMISRLLEICGRYGDMDLSSTRPLDIEGEPLFPTPCFGPSKMKIEDCSYHAGCLTPNLRSRTSYDPWNAWNYDTFLKRELATLLKIVATDRWHVLVGRADQA